MRYRKLSEPTDTDPGGDYTFAQGPNNFWINQREAVAQAVKTRLLLEQGEWFLDKSEGTPYDTQILGMGKTPLYDQAIRARILGTQGVTGIADYSSTLDTTRNLKVRAVIDTVYGQTTVEQAL